MEGLYSHLIDIIFAVKGAGASEAEIRKVFDTLKTGDTSTRKSVQSMGDFEKALRRVIIVAPVWMAFRAVLQQTFSILSDGFKVWEEFDRQLIKSKAVIHDYAGTTDEAMKILEDRIRTFSTESGIALKDLASAFYRFGTVGLAFEDSLSGAIASAKLARATLGDVDTISRSLAMTYRLLGDTIDNTLTPMQKQESLAGKIFYLWKTNAFEANEFAGSLNNFISTANIANFTADQTIALLAALGTAGVQGSRGGTLLKTAIQKLVENLDILAPKLGLAVNPELEDTFNLLMRVLTAVNELSQTEGIPKEALKSIQEIFGGVRGAQVISALNALLPELKQNLIDVGKDPQKFISELKKRMDEVTDSVPGQLDIFRRLREQIGESFVKGLVGASDFKNALISINGVMEQLVIISNKIGGTFFMLAHPLTSAKLETQKINEEYKILEQRINKAISGVSSLADIIELIAELEERNNKAGGLYIGIVNRLKEVANYLIKQPKLTEDQNQKLNTQHDILKELSVAMQDKIGLAKQELKILRLQAGGASDLFIEHKKLDNILNILVDRYNNLKDSQSKQVEQISLQAIKTDLLRGNFEGVLNIFKQMELTEDELNRLITSYLDISKENVKTAEILINHELDLLKLRGAGSKQLLEAEIQYKKLIFGEDAVKNSLEYRLKLEKEITKEKMLQIDIADDTKTLYKIATEQSLDAAKAIADVLSGRDSVENLKQMTKYWEIFQKYFPQRFENLKIAEFFGISPFQKGLGGGKYYGAPGGQIPIVETGALKSIQTMIELAQAGAKGQFPNATINLPEISGMTINVSTVLEGTTKEEKVKYLQNKIADAIRTDPEVEKALNEKIDQF